MNNPSLTRPHLASISDLLKDLRVRQDVGLPSSQIQQRRQQHGSNILPVTKSSGSNQVLIDRIKDPLVIVLIGAGFISLLFKEFADAIIIAIAIALDAILSYIQVRRTEKTLAQIAQHVKQNAHVKRDGKFQDIPAKQLVVGDIIELHAGERVPADARLIKVQGLQTHEAALTGESSDVVKQSVRLSTKTPLADQTNMVFMGTAVVSGTAEAVVISTGTKTEYGKIAQVLRSQPKIISPLRRKLQKSGLQIGLVILAAIILLTAINLFTGKGITETIQTSVALLVSAIPEDLTMILTITLTIGVARILRKGGVVKQLTSAETLGAATVICIDKTGTLTAGQMTAQKLDFLQGFHIDEYHPPKESIHSHALIGLALGSDARRVNPESTEYIGSATGRTALAFAEKFGINLQDLNKHWRVRDSISFNAKWKYSAKLCDHPRQGHRSLFVSGAPDILLEKSSRALNDRNEVIDLSSSYRRHLSQKIHQLSSEGKHLLAVAVRSNVSVDSITHDDINNLTFLGVLTITDPIREEVPAAIQSAESAGIKVKVITGDALPTARTVARQVGLTVTDDTVIAGTDIEQMSDKELSKAVEHIVIFARVTPLDKQRIVKALQKNGHVVAMTGDGVNDAVALKTADIGVAMGSGKDITKDAADMILLSDSFSTITSAIKEGRVLRDNLRKVISFLLTTNSAEVAIFFASIFLGLPIPLLPAQILWINIVTDGTSDVSLAFEPAERNIMNRQPDDPQGPLLGKNYLMQAAFAGIVMTIIAMALYAYLNSIQPNSMGYIRTMIFTFVSVTSLITVWSWRSAYETIFQRGLWQNRWILLSASVSLLLQVLAVYAPPLQKLFETVPLSLNDWLIIFALAILSLLVIDSRKLFLSPETTLNPT